MKLSVESIANYFGAHQVPGRVAHEKDRANQRLVVVTIFFAITLWVYYGQGQRTMMLGFMPQVLALYCAATLLYRRAIVAKPERYVLSQYLFMVLDPAITVMVAITVPQIVAPVITMLLLMQIVRPGIRYGPRAMWLSWWVAALASAVLMLFSPFWVAQTQLLHAHAAMILLMPIVFGPLIRKLHNVTTELRAAATSDPLTGLGNRRILSEHLTLAQQRCKRDRSMLAVLVFDIDNFKPVNDTLGHAVGDRLLERIASTIKLTCRAGDFLARTGGDEFVLLVEGLALDTGVAQAQQMGAKLIASVQSAAREVCPTIDVSASVGVRCWSHVGTEPMPAQDDLLDAADHAMYRAKRSGKAQVATA